MADVETIRNCVEQKVHQVTTDPASGCGTATTRVTLGPDLACEIEDGPWKITAGMSAVWGGSNAGPNPGVLGRGALGSCLAIGYAIWAARLEVPLTALEVVVQGDYDARGELGISEEVAPGYLAMRYHVTVTSPATEAEVRRMLDIADRFSPYLHLYANPREIRREITIRPA